MICLSIAAASGFTLLYKKGPRLIFLGRLFNSFKFRLVSANHFDAMYYYKLAIILFNKLILMLEIVFKFFFQCLYHSKCSLF